MKSESARTADNSSKQTSTASRDVVQNPAQIDLSQDSLNFATVKAIKYVGKEDVYNMEVEDYHCFSVNGGLIVHNCIDALRYAYENEMESRAVTAEKAF